MVQVASLSLVVSLMLAAGIVGAASLGLKTGDPRWLRRAVSGMYGLAGLLTLSVGFLLYFLLQGHFQVQYVASYTDSHLPTLYVVSALWAGQEGSLLLWTWLLAVCGAVWVRGQGRSLTDLSNSPGASGTSKDYPRALAFVLIVLGLTTLAFLLLLTIQSNPFHLLDFIPKDGQGMNPLLQNPYMAIHPPVLFIGYAGFVIPFALAFAALASGTLERSWVQSLRNWTLFAWYFLGIGIVLGGHWAYLELGWGGYWSWDPVENASFIPWLTSTALLHGLILQQRKGLLRLWNLLLSILTFALCIFATFITRSGIISSVHAFSQSPAGIYFMVLLAVIAGSGGGLLAWRWKTFRTRSQEDRLISKENSFFLSIQVLFGFGFAVLYGTLYPLFTEWSTGEKVMLEMSFYNTIAIMLGLTLLALIGICQRFSWKSLSGWALARRFVFPGVVMAALLLMMALLDIAQPGLWFACGLSAFALITIGQDVGDLLASRTSFTAMLALIRQQKRHLASHVFHLGIVLIVIGIGISATFKQEFDIMLRPGDAYLFGTLRVEYVTMHVSEDAQKGVAAADVKLYRDEQYLATVTPEKHFYGDPANPQVTTEIGLYTSFTEDIYVILAGWNELQEATFTVIINPMIIWIWIGGFVMFTLGALLIALPRFSRTASSEA